MYLPIYCITVSLLTLLCIELKVGAVDLHQRRITKHSGVAEPGYFQRSDHCWKSEGEIRCYVARGYALGFLFERVLGLMGLTFCITEFPEEAFSLFSFVCHF